MASVCVYCGAVGPLTREHIMPASILQRVPPNSMRYIESAEKVILTDPVIKDVCTSCNGGVLSRLDSYGCELFDTHFCNPPQPGKTVTFTYDFNQLSRWLLKISYNSARSSKHEDASVLTQYVPDIIGGTSPNIALCLDLIEPALEETTTEKGIAVVQTLNPRTLRISRMYSKNGYTPRLHIRRLVAIQGYWFALVIPTANNHSEDERQSEQELIISQWPNVSVLSPNRTAITLSTLGNNVVDMSKDNILAKAHLYQKAMDQIDAKRKNA